MHLLISIRLHNGRYHGEPEWPPSPARLFQALVAGAGSSGPFDKDEPRALAWLEGRQPPVVGVPAVQDGQRVMFYMPNNDLDVVGGDSERIAEIRTAKKFFRPKLFDATVPFLYAWSLDADEECERQARAICALAEDLYQFGRGIDMAGALGEVLNDDATVARLATYPGRLYHPSAHGVGVGLACATPGSLNSLKERYTAGSRRFQVQMLGNIARKGLFQIPKPRFAQVAYESPPSRCVYDLRGTQEAEFAPWPLARASKLVVCLRDSAADWLRRALPEQNAEIERALIGRKTDVAGDGPSSSRVKIVPLSSIGHQHADCEIRRVLVEVPPDCPLSSADVHWAFCGRRLVDAETGAELDVILTPSADENMLRRYGVSVGSTGLVWRTVTPSALPESARRRRIDPAHVVAEAKDGTERAAEQTQAVAAVIQALRHAEVRAHALAIRVQREPFEANGKRVEVFASGTRFPKERLWHVEIAFDAPVGGPLVIGDGRFLGLGVMRPVQDGRTVHAFVVDGGIASAPEPSDVARALRRAVMARVQDVFGKRATLPTFFTGHDANGLPAQRESRPHLTYLFDPILVRLLIVAPHIVERRYPSREERSYLDTLGTAMTGFRELRAGSAGCLMVRTSDIDAEADPLFAPARVWESVTPYQVTRHTKHASAAEALSADVRAECRRCGLPEPHVTPFALYGLSGVGLMGNARLTFEVAVKGPVILGRSRYLGGGLFAGTLTGGSLP